MQILLYILISSITIFIAAQILPGVHLASYATAVIVAVVLGIVNSIIRPILLILTLPINILTLGLFTFVIMGAMVMLTSAIVPGFKVDSFWWAMGFAIALWIINSFLSKIEDF